MNRREFLRNTAFTASALAIGEKALPANDNAAAAKNKLPRWKGFNLLDYFSATPGRNPDASRTTEDDFRWMADWGFDFVRLPMAYPRYITFDRSKPVTKDDLYNSTSSTSAPSKVLYLS